MTNAYQNGRGTESPQTAQNEQRGGFHFSGEDPSSPEPLPSLLCDTGQQLLGRFFRVIGILSMSNACVRANALLPESTNEA